jgi:cytoskeletal protein CcmA (bactofilin family)
MPKVFRRVQGPRAEVPPSIKSRLAVIAAGTTLSGDLESSDPVEVYGTLEGDARVSGRFMVAESGRVFGNVDAHTIVIAGEVTAGLLNAERIELRATARVTARLRGRVVAVADGAVFQGDIEQHRE